MRSSRRVRARADRRRRRDHAVELPVHAEPLEDRARARGRQHGRAEARARHAVERDVRSASSSPRRPTSRPACSTSSRRRDQATVGEMLTGDPRVDMVTLHRARPRSAGASWRAAPTTLKQVFLELGGKSAQHRPRRRRLRGRCVAERRDGVHARRAGLRDHDAHAAAALALRRGRRAAEGRVRERAPTATRPNPATCMGPLDQRDAARARARLHREGQGRGRAARGRRRPARRTSPKGYFVEPTLFVDVDPDSTIAQEEIFGPVLVGDPVRGRRRRGADREQLELRALGRGDARRRSSARWRSRGGIRTGTVSVNGGMWFGPDSPFGGYKQSGIGREHGVAGLRGVPRDQDDRVLPRVDTQADRHGTRDLPASVPAEVRLGRGGAAAPQGAARRRVPAVRAVRLRRGRRRPHHRPRPRAPRPLLGEPVRDELQAHPGLRPDPRQRPGRGRRGRPGR